MAEARSRADWAIASSIIANLANAIPFRTKAVQPAAYNPWDAPPAPKAQPEVRLPLSMLCSALLSSQGHPALQDAGSGGVGSGGVVGIGE